MLCGLDRGVFGGGNGLLTKVVSEAFCLLVNVWEVGDRLSGVMNDCGLGEVVLERVEKRVVVE